jgi:hypothetical protein
VQDSWLELLRLQPSRLSAAGDLRVGNLPLTRSKPQAFLNCESIVYQRHKALNWLVGEQRIYPDITVDT